MIWHVAVSSLLPLAKQLQAVEDATEKKVEHVPGLTPDDLSWGNAFLSTVDGMVVNSLRQCFMNIRQVSPVSLILLRDRDSCPYADQAGLVEVSGT